MDQLELTPAARASDPETSHQAAKSVSSLREKQAAVLHVLRGCRMGLSDDGIANTYALHERLPDQSPSGLRTRRSELVALGLVEDSGERVRLPSGRSAIVWRTVA